MTTQMKVTFSDFAGDDTATESFYLAGVVTDPTSGIPATLLIDLEAISSAAVRSVVLLPTDNVPVGEDDGGPYHDIEDKLVLEFISASGMKARYSFPSPGPDSFLGNTDELDDDDPETAALIAVLETNAKGTDGSALTFVKGYRKRTRRHKPK